MQPFLHERMSCTYSHNRIFKITPEVSGIRENMDDLTGAHPGEGPGPPPPGTPFGTYPALDFQCFFR